MAKEEFIRVGTTLYKIVEQPKLNGGYVRKRICLLYTSDAADE